MKVVGVIPARFGSTRFPGKPLHEISGKPMLQWVIEGVKQSQKLSELLVATDDQRIADLAEKLGVGAVMTDSELPSGSDRVFAAVQGIDADLVLNIQGDEPLIEGAVVDALVDPFVKDPGLQMATLAKKLSPGDLESETTAKIVVDQDFNAIYFSRFPIPYSRQKRTSEAGEACCYKHIGLYAYSKAFLREFCQQAPTPLEQMEGLEQLRALYLGAKIRVNIVSHESWGVDTPEDVNKIEELIKNR